MVERMRRKWIEKVCREAKGLRKKKQNKYKTENVELYKKERKRKKNIEKIRKVKKKSI